MKSQKIINRSFNPFKKGILVATLLFISLLVAQPANSEDCITGGPGSVSCSYTTQGNGGLTIFGVTVIRGKSKTYAVSCAEGFYSCCETAGASCKQNASIESVE